MAEDGILLLSDAHLRGLDDPNQHALLGFLDSVPFEALVLVGDIYDVWWASAGSVPLDSVPVLSALRSLVDAGRPVTWVAGNHDWAPRVDALGVQVAEQWTQTVSGRRLIAVHGDEGADPRLRNRVAQRALKSPLTKVVGRVLGTSRVQRVGHALSSHSRKGHAGKRFAVLERQNALADRLHADGNDVVFVGHSHCPGMLPRRGGMLVNLGDWLHHKSYARVSDGAIRLFRWTGEETPMPEGPPQRWPWADAG